MRCAPRFACSAAILASLVFTFVVATLAAKSRRAELVILPALDILQSVPVLGLLALHRGVLHRPVSAEPARCGVRGDLRDLHQPGLEHGLQFLSVPAHRAG